MTATAPAGQHTVRRHNCALVLAAVAESPGLSRAGVAARTGLTKATVSSLVDRLVAASLVREEGPARRGGPGRPGTSLSLCPTGPHGLGVEIAVDYVATCLVGLTGRVWHERIEYGDNRALPAERVLDHVGRSVTVALDRAARAEVAVGGIGLAVPGLVESSSGLLRVAPNLGWRGIDVPAALRARVAMPTTPMLVGNEANLAALAELHAPGRESVPRDFVFVSGEIGIGAGLVVDGALVDGTHGFGGELGHFPVDPRGPHCRCGARGCLERMAGQDALLDRAGVADLDALVGALESGERDARTAVHETARLLGTALSGVLNLLDIPAVVLGGTYARVFPWLAEPLHAELTDRVVSAPWTPVKVLCSALGTEAAARGAAGAAVRTVLTDPEAFIAG